jgi:ABC-type polysaccharide/polyol phosphate export permease
LSLTKVTPSIVYERTLLQKAKFPIEAIPLSIIFSNFFHTIISLFIFIPLLLINHLVDMGNLILLLPALLWLLFLTVSLSLLTATLNVKYRDVNFFVQTILVIWFYATPIIYDVVLIPKELILLLKFNPLTGIFELIHRALLNQGALDTSIILINLLITIIIFIVSFLIFRKENKYFVDWL